MRISRYRIMAVTQNCRSRSVCQPSVCCRWRYVALSPHRRAYRAVINESWKQDTWPHNQRQRRWLNYIHIRNYSSNPLSNAAYAAIHLAEDFFQTVHHYSHLPWWAVIGFSTITLRSLMTLPLAVYQSKVIAKIELLAPTLKEYQEAVKHNVVVKCKRANLPVEEANRRLMKEAKKVTRQLYRQEGCHPYKMAVLPWVQLPLWISLSLALRNMTGYFPGLTPPPGAAESFAVEGILWFQDLTIPDPHSILPIVLAITNLLNIELNSLRRKSPSRTQRIMTNMFRVLSVGMGYVGSQMPAGMTLYWSISSSYGLVQNILFKFPSVRRLLTIPKTPSESKHPFRDLAKIMKEKAQAFVRLQRESLKRKE